MNYQSSISSPPVEQVVVTTRQMQMIESALFAAGMPVTALMEKVAGKVVDWIIRQFPCDRAPAVGVIVGPGHNGGDALVVARELYHRGYQVLVWCPFPKLKELTARHKAYLEFLNVPTTESSAAFKACNFIVDGGFGIGLTRPLPNDLAEGINLLNASAVPIVSIDLPSGLDSDTGAVQGTAVRAQHTLCLGLWKLGLLQDQAQPWIGQLHLIPFDIPAFAIQKTLADSHLVQCITAPSAITRLPLPRSPIAHKYTAGHVLLIAGSRQYGGAALLAGQGALASGVGMLTLVVPESLRLMVLAQLPEALVIGASETSSGAIAAIPDAIAWSTYDVIACGPGLTVTAAPIVTAVLPCDRPIVLDADALNVLAQSDPQALLSERSAPTLLTPHPGEFRRLFPDAWETAATKSLAAKHVAQMVDCTLILKGAMSAIAHADGQLWINQASTPALARGGSGDVLTGLVAGLAAQKFQSKNVTNSFLDAAIAAVWWHAQAGRYLAAQGTELGSAASHLGRILPTALANQLNH
ncbi:MAG: NAD(P)H-hydrate dehydratase [Cyanobacteria bacterium P01_C01_bin.70]